MTLTAGAQLGPYRVLSPLGAGGMGEVYRARDTRLDRDVALKVLPDAVTSDPERLRRFELEAKAAGALNHPNILAVYDVGSHEGRAYLVSELLEGETLRERMRAGDLTRKRALEIGIGIAHGLAAAHAKGIVHRDLKPDNVFVLTDGRVKLLDFGLAKLKKPDDAVAHDAETSPQTEAGFVMGTAAYMSPEQVRSQPLDQRSDLFSLGVVLHEMLSGRRPFQGDTTAELFASILRDDPPELKFGGDDRIGPGIEQLVRRCLGKRPDERFSSAHDLALALEAITSSPHAQATVATPSATAAPARSVEGRITVAVLPFVNLSHDPENDYFADGITEDVIAQLSRINAFRVIARTSAMQFKKREASLRSIGERLGVARVVDGSVRRAGNRVRIVAQLIDVATEEHLWAETYDRELSDVFAIQTHVALRVAEALRAVLSPSEKERVQKPPTTNMDAYNAYLLGKFQWNKRTDEGLNRAIAQFEHAVALDPTYAAAYAGLSDALILAGAAYSVAPPKDWRERGLAAAARALELDDGLPAVHTSLGYARIYGEWRYAAGEAAFKEALRLNPSHAPAHEGCMFALLAQGRFEEALGSAQRAAELDPLSVAIATEVSMPLTFMGRYDEALTQIRKALELDPGFAVAHYSIGNCYEREGRYDEAIAAFREAVRLSGRLSYFMATLGRSLAFAGNHGDARLILGELLERARRSPSLALPVAVVHDALGEKDEALNWLERACGEREAFAGLLAVKQWRPFENVRQEPRFQALLERIKRVSEGKDRPSSSSAILVLPFRDLSPQHDNEYFSDGLTEELIADLSRIRSLRVIARASAMRLKGSTEELRAIAGRLDVSHVLEGSVRKAGNDLRVTAQLVDVSRNSPIWSNKYSGTLDDVFGIQERLSASITEALQVEMSGSARRDLQARSITDAQAFECYLRARHEMWQWNAEALERARQLLESGLTLVGSNALLLSSLGMVHIMLEESGVDLERDHLHLAESCSARVLTLDASSAQGHLLKGMIERLRGATRSAAHHLKAGLDVEPANPDLLAHLANVYAISGRQSQARPLVTRLLAVDPLTSFNQCMPGWMDLLDGRFAEALPAYERGVALAPENQILQLFCAWVLVICGRGDEARPRFEALTRQNSGTPFGQLGRFWRFVLDGQREEAVAAITPQLRAASRHAEYLARLLSEGCALVGSKDQALAFLSQAVDLGFINYPYLHRVDPLLDRLRPTPEFAALLEKVKVRWEAFDE